VPLHEAWLELPSGELFWLKGRCSVGRQADNDLVLEDTALSRHHALLNLAPEGCIITDLRSSNGTYVNQVPVTRPVALQDADKVSFGNFVVTYRCTRRSPGEASSRSPEHTRRIDDVRERTCWLLVADLAGYSALIARVGSEAALRQLRTWIGDVRPAIEQNGGQINAYLGDAVFAWWPADGPAAAPGPLLAALEALGAYRSRSALPFRVVVHHGTALFTRNEHGEEMSGQEVNFVFRAEKIAKRLGLAAMLSEAAVRSLGVAARCSAAGTSAVDGIPGDFSFFLLKE
jgi:adenylate cyclase